MAGSVNKVILVGRVGRDPEVKTIGSGTKVANFSIATSETWRDKSSGDRKEKTEWHNVVVFNENLLKVVEQYLRKGTLVYLEGSLQTRSWEDQSGQKRYATEIVLARFRGELQMIGGRGDNGGSESEGSDRGGSNEGGYSSNQMEDEIPF